MSKQNVSLLAIMCAISTMAQFWATWCGNTGIWWFMGQEVYWAVHIGMLPLFYTMAEEHYLQLRDSRR